MTPSTENETTRRLRVRLLALTVVALVVGVVGSLVTFTGLFVPGRSDEESRSAVVDRVTAFATVYNTYDVSQKADYQRRMKPLLTPSYYKDFTKVTDGIFSALQGKKQRSGDVDVLSVAVDELDGDSASALVAVDASISTEGSASALRRFRWKVDLVRDDGSWRVRKFDSVIPAEATTGDPSPSASPSASGADQ
ncbi:MAG: hypothetical protein PGN07_01580 [Aeromicrobium erythreum]